MEVLNGSWKNNKLHGIGEDFNPKTGSFIGEYQNGVKHGLGVVLFQGTITKEHWKHGRRCKSVVETNVHKIDFLTRFACEKNQIQENALMSRVYKPCHAYCEPFSICMKKSLFSDKTSLFSTRNLNIGDLVFEESPTFTLHWTRPQNIQAIENKIKNTLANQDGVFCDHFWSTANNITCLDHPYTLWQRSPSRLASNICQKKKKFVGT